MDGAGTLIVRQDGTTTARCTVNHFTDFAVFMGPPPRFNPIVLEGLWSSPADNLTGFSVSVSMLAFVCLVCCCGMREYRSVVNAATGAGKGSEEDELDSKAAQARKAYEEAASFFAHEVKRSESRAVPWTTRKLIGLRTRWLWCSAMFPVKGDPWLRFQRLFIVLLQVLISMALNILFYRVEAVEGEDILSDYWNGTACVNASGILTGQRLVEGR